MTEVNHEIISGVKHSHTDPEDESPFATQNATNHLPSDTVYHVTKLESSAALL
jgi:hypothetical protein